MSMKITKLLFIMIALIFLNVAPINAAVFNEAHGYYRFDAGENWESLPTSIPFFVSKDAKTPGTTLSVLINNKISDFSNLTQPDIEYMYIQLLKDDSYFVESFQKCKINNLNALFVVVANKKPNQPRLCQYIIDCPTYSLTFSFSTPKITPEFTEQSNKMLKSLKILK